MLQECQNVTLAAKARPDRFSPLSPSLSLTKHDQHLFWGACASILAQRCPACFGSQDFGWLLDNGGDIHVAMDGNFHHWHQCSAGDCLHFYDPVYFLPKSQVNNVGQQIDTAHKQPPRQCNTAVPDEVVDQCETSYEAADGKKQKMAIDSFNDTSIMALICHHDIPLFFPNINTPGEQQKYSVALIEHFFSLIPFEANIVILYNIRCVLVWSLMKVRMSRLHSIGLH